MASPLGLPVPFIIGIQYHAAGVQAGTAMMARITITAFLADALNHSGADGNGAPAAKKQEKGCRKKGDGYIFEK